MPEPRTVTVKQVSDNTFTLDGGTGVKIKYSSPLFLQLLITFFKLPFSILSILFSRGEVTFKATDEAWDKFHRR